MTLAGAHPVAFAVVRFTAFAAHGALFGLVPVTLLALRRGFAVVPAGRYATRGRDAVARRLLLTVQWALLLGAVAAVGSLVLQAAVVAGVRASGVTPSTVVAALSTPAGQWTALRLFLLGALALVVPGRLRTWVLRGAGDGQSAPPALWWWSWGALAAALLATLSLTGHAVTSAVPALTVPADLLHLAAAAAWLTGVVVLGTVLPAGWAGLRAGDQTLLVAGVVVPFSRLALVAVPVVAVTGVVAALVHVGSADALRTTAYGQAVLVKGWLFLWVLAFGACNHFWLRRRLSDERPGHAARARRLLTVTVAGELVFGVLVLGATAVLVGLPAGRL